MPTDPIIAFAVRTTAGIVLKLDQSAAELYAVQHHGTVHRLVEWVEPIDFGAQQEPEAPARRMPQGDLTPSGLVHI
jgi:hypothetical protein